MLVLLWLCVHVLVIDACLRFDFRPSRKSGTNSMCTDYFIVLVKSSVDGEKAKEEEVVIALH